LFTGAVLTETIFGWEGMGRYLVTTISKNDVHADVAVVALDPRVRVNGS
jgi:peptide/nickel transport system permease protein